MLFKGGDLLNAAATADAACGLRGGIGGDDGKALLVAAAAVADVNPDGDDTVAADLVVVVLPRGDVWL